MLTEGVSLIVFNWNTPCSDGCSVGTSGVLARSHRVWKRASNMLVDVGDKQYLFGSIHASTHPDLVLSYVIITDILVFPNI
jgi:hypothetical protein